MAGVAGRSGANSPLLFQSFRPEPRYRVTKGTVMDRSVINTATMNSVSSTLCFENVVVGVAILGRPALLHARGLSWRRASSGSRANREAADGFAQA
jgi:hypothetical protein